ncbi:Brix-domain-containing protein [Acaromyces ingoldii]|uniref:Ribosome production factor 2 homolog n=1 Tax=Acaromyces ingoldii TaxID=215250 RepID=A0A316YS59_9BASI|nr:Brix-domain-containing protein [Acaromyces ingoldii]PWN91654.1 Brix-domain-containing protein [Acaromyces ingoldii]
MIRASKPRNARSKRALEKRESKELESAKTAIFVRGSHTSEAVSCALKELAGLKKPHSIPFSKRNDVAPFEDASSIEFWAAKNDASLFVVGNHQKKRKDNLTFVRTFDGQVLDMYELGITMAKSHEEFKSKRSPTVGARPLFHFSGPHFSNDPSSSLVEGQRNNNTALAASQMASPGLSSSFQHLKSLFLDFYRGEELPPGSGPGKQPGQAGAQVALKGGLQHIISITEAPGPEEEGISGVNGTSAAIAPDLAALYAAGAATASSGSDKSKANLDSSAAGRTIHFRVYAVVDAGAAKGGAAELEEIGPAFDFVLRRRLPGDVGRWSAALRRPKLAEEKNRQGKGEKKNIETDEMGDTVGRIHMGKQDLDKLQTRKMKGLKRARAAAGADGSDEDEDDDDVADLMGDDDDESLDMEDLTGGADDDDDDDHDDDDEGDEEDGEEGAAPERKRRR